MPDALLPPDAIAHDRVRRIAAALAPAIARVAPDQSDAAWQDGLDLVALIAGMKRVCLIGRGLAGRDWVEALRRMAMDFGLPMLGGAPWAPVADEDALPEWYLAATARHRAAHPVLYICDGEATRQDVASLCARGRVRATAEAELLSYPPCCVAAHHRQARALEQFVAEKTLRIAGGDIARATRMIATGAVPLPSGPQERPLWDELTALRPAPATSVNMCDSCAADPISPARLLSQRYAALAAIAFDPPLDS